MTGNPYQPPVFAPTPLTEGPLEIRTRHINHEASVRSIGILYYLAALSFGISASGLISSASGTSGESPEAILVPLAFAGAAVLSALVGRGIRILKPSARILAIILSCVGLLAFPIGTIISVYALWLLISKKGSVVFSAEYKDVIAATPGVKYRTSRVIWIILGIVILVIAFSAVWGIFIGMRG